jgi:hypothetical protein
MGSIISAIDDNPEWKDRYKQTSEAVNVFPSKYGFEVSDEELKLLQSIEKECEKCKAHFDYWTALIAIKILKP